MFIHIIRILLIICAYLLVCALGYLGFLTISHNLVGWYLIIVALAYALGGPYLLRRHLKEEQVKRKEKYDRSFWLVFPGFIGVYYLPPFDFVFLPVILPRVPGLQVIGLVLLALSLILFCWARLSLRDMYSGKLQVRNGDTLVTTGSYHFIRHPAYASYILMGLGICVGYSSLVGTFALVGLLIPGLIYRMDVEEKILSTEYGERYDRYKEVTKRIIPGIW